MFINAKPRCAQAGLLAGAGLFCLSLMAPASAGLFDDEQTQRAVQRNANAIASLESRSGQLESEMARRGQLLDLIQQIQMLQSEVRSLRGQLEEQTFANEQLKRRQRELYGDLDDRLNALAARPVAPPADPWRDAPVSPPPADNASTALGAATTAVPATPAPSPQAGGAPEARYRAALDALFAKDYSTARQELEGFLRDYPAAPLAGNAQYWLGETFYVTRDFDAALKAFIRLSERFPASDKNAGALLKRGYILHELGQLEQARQLLEQVRKVYPSSTEARLAAERIAKLTGSR